VNQDQGKTGMSNATGAVLDPAMSLVGRLEDLSLGEILQIVSLSKRSGLLRLESPAGKANIYIRSGKIIYVARSDEKEGPLSLLVHHGFVKMDQMEAIRGELESSINAGQIRDLLDEKLGVTPDSFQKVLKNRVKELIYSLFHWEEGTFSFQLVQEEEKHPLLEKMAPYFLDQGIEVQFLVLEGARRKDEMGRQPPPEMEAPGRARSVVSPETEGDREQESGKQLSGGPVSEEETAELIRELDEFTVPEVLPFLYGPSYGTVILIGLSRTFAAGIANAVKGKGITLLIHEEGADGLSQIQELRENRISPFLLLDIEAAGITDDRRMGGLEIISTIWDLGFSLPVGLVHKMVLPKQLQEKLDLIPGIRLFPVFDPSAEAEAVAAALRLIETTFSESSGAQPRVEKNPLVPRAGEAVVDHQGPVPMEPGGNSAGMQEKAPEYYDIQRELVDDLDGIDLPFEGWEEEGTPQDKPVDPLVAQLSSYVTELNRQDISGEITLLALRFASAFVARAVLFLVRKGDMKGLGQFGVDLGEGKDADSAVRSLTLPMGREGIFSRVIANQQSYKGPPTGSDVERNLFEALGGDPPDEIYIGPIVSMGKVAVLLYGDDHPGNTGIESTHTLDIFLSHVGLALDRAFLEMKLKTRRS